MRRWSQPSGPETCAARMAATDAKAIRVSRASGPVHAILDQVVDDLGFRKG